MKIEFDERTHTYRYDGKVIPSVTEICKAITGNHYGAINKSVLDYASRRGTAIHEACQDIDLDLEPDVDAETLPYVQAYCDFLRDYRPEWDFIEQIVVDRNGRYAGMVDRAGLMLGEPVVVDIKTISSLTKPTKVAVCVQTSAYEMAIGDTAKRYALHLQKNGKYRLFSCDEYEEENKFNSHELFNKLLNINAEIRRLTE